MLGEESTLGIIIITVAFFVTVLVAGFLVMRVVRDPSKAIGARTRERWEAHEDARRLEAERRKLEAERAAAAAEADPDAAADAGTGAGTGADDGDDRSPHDDRSTDGPDGADEEDGTHE